MKLVGSLVLLALPGWAAAVSLDYQRPDGDDCPDEASLRKLVAARLGVDPFVTGAASRVTVKIFSGKPLRAEVAVESDGAAPRRKVLTGADCVELAQSVAVTVALVVDPLVSRAPEPLPAPERAAEAAPAPAPPAAPPPEAVKPAEPAAPALRWGAGLGASVNGGLSTGAQPVLRAEGRAYAGRWSVGLEGRFAIPVTGALQSGAGLTTSALLAAVVPCLHFAWFAGCADVTLGGLRLEGSALSSAQAATVFHASAGLRLLFSVPVTERLFISALAEGQVPFTRTSAVVGTTKVWTLPPVGGGLGLTVSFVL